MNIASNPWSFTNADVVVATPAASPSGLILNADKTVTLTTTGATTFAVGNGITIAGATNAAYNGYYVVKSVTSTTVYVLIPQFSIPAGTAASGGGTAGLCLYNSQVRIEDMSWQNASAAGQLLDLRDRNGNILWQATASGANVQNRGKLFWVNGFTPFNIQSGVVIVTTN